jgi:hypothetical protein
MANEKKVTNGVFNLAKQLISEGIGIQEVKAAVIKKYMEDGRDGGTAKKYANIIVCMAKKRVNANKNKVEVKADNASPVEQQIAPSVPPKAKTIREDIEPEVEEILEKETDEVSSEFWDKDSEEAD